MKKINIPDIGHVVYWEDFIKLSPPDEYSVIKYEQSNTRLPNYHQRVIGLYLREGIYYVSVAVSHSPSKNLPSKVSKGMINTRLRSILSKNDNIDVTDMGSTLVPKSYLSLLYKDPAAYNYLYGPMDPTMLDMSIKVMESQ